VKRHYIRKIEKIPYIMPFFYKSIEDGETGIHDVQNHFFNFKAYTESIIKIKECLV